MHSGCYYGLEETVNPEVKIMKQLQKIEVLIFCALLMLIIGCGGGYFLPEKVAFSTAQLNEVKVMTFNIRTRTIIDGPNHWNHRKGFVADTIAGNGADIVGLQEAKNSQLEYVRSMLPQYAVYAVGRSDGVRGGESCPILYRKDRFTAVESGTFWFSDTPSIPGSKDWGNMPPRICSWVHLFETKTSNGFYVYNLHLDNLSQNSREKSVQLLMDKIAIRKTGDPFIIMGDFNMEIQNPAMRWLSKLGIIKPRLASIDVWQSIHPNRSIGTRHGFSGDLSGPHIDHIRLSSNLQAMDARIDMHSRNGRFPSDHFPVVANIRFDLVRSDRRTTVTAHASIDDGKDSSFKAGML